nr:MAG TPA: hypothetical protein [Caudoviricetes sp.]
MESVITFMMPATVRSATNESACPAPAGGLAMVGVTNVCVLPMGG